MKYVLIIFVLLSAVSLFYANRYYSQLVQIQMTFDQFRNAGIQGLRIEDGKFVVDANQSCFISTATTTQGVIIKFNC